MFTTNPKNISSVIIKYWPCLLILLAFIGFISKALYNYPIGIMAILGLYKIITDHRILLQDQILKTFTIVFLCLWLPLLISFPDAVNPGHSSHTIFPYLRFFFAGVFIIEEISMNKDRLRFIVPVYFLLFFSCVLMRQSSLSSIVIFWDFPTILVKLQACFTHAILLHIYALFSLPFVFYTFISI